MMNEHWDVLAAMNELARALESYALVVPIAEPVSVPWDSRSPLEVYIERNRDHLPVAMIRHDGRSYDDFGQLVLLHNPEKPSDVISAAESHTRNLRLIPGD